MIIHIEVLVEERLEEQLEFPMLKSKSMDIKALNFLTAKDHLLQAADKEALQE